MSKSGTYKYINGKVVRVSEKVPNISRPSNNIRQDNKYKDKYGVKDLITIDQAKGEGLLAESYKSPFGENGGL